MKFMDMGTEYRKGKDICAKTVDDYRISVAPAVDTDTKKTFYFVFFENEPEFGPCDSLWEAREFYNGIKKGYYTEDDNYTW